MRRLKQEVKRRKIALMCTMYRRKGGGKIDLGDVPLEGVNAGAGVNTGGPTPDGE